MSRTNCLFLKWRGSSARSPGRRSRTCRSSLKGKAEPVLEKIEIIRGFAAQTIGLVKNIHDAKNMTPSIPLLAIVSEKQDYNNYLNDGKISAQDIDFVSRVFYMQEMHKTYSATAAICTAVSAMIEGTITNRLMKRDVAQQKTVRIGHPCGIIDIEIEVKRDKNTFKIQKAAIGRTSRRIMEGYVLVYEQTEEGRIYQSNRKP